jgi:hypothetical protein
MIQVYMIWMYLIETDQSTSDVIKNFTLLINTWINENSDVKYSSLRTLVNTASKLVINDVDNAICS